MATHQYKRDSRVKRAAIWSIFVLALVSGIFVLFYLEPNVLQSYLISSPRAPQESTAQIHAFNQHGYIVYFSSSQQHNLLWLKAWGMLQLLIAGIAWHYLGFGDKRRPEITGNDT